MQKKICNLKPGDTFKFSLRGQTYVVGNKYAFGIQYQRLGVRGAPLYDIGYNDRVRYYKLVYVVQGRPNRARYRVKARKLPFTYDLNFRKKEYRRLKSWD